MYMMPCMAETLYRLGSGEDPISVRIQGERGWFDTTPADLSHDMPYRHADEFVVSYRATDRDVKNGTFRGMVRDRINLMIENGEPDATIARGIYAECFGKGTP